MRAIIRHATFDLDISVRMAGAERTSEDGLRSGVEEENRENTRIRRALARWGRGTNIADATRQSASRLKHNRHICLLLRSCRLHPVDIG